MNILKKIRKFFQGPPGPPGPAGPKGDKGDRGLPGDAMHHTHDEYLPKTGGRIDGDLIVKGFVRAQNNIPEHDE